MDGDPPQMQAPAAGNMYNIPWYTYTWRCWTRNSRRLTMVGETLNDISTAATEPISPEKVSSESLKSSPKKTIEQIFKNLKGDGRKQSTKVNRRKLRNGHFEPVELHDGWSWRPHSNAGKKPTTRRLHRHSTAAKYVRTFPKTWCESWKKRL